MRKYILVLVVALFAIGCIEVDTKLYREGIAKPQYAEGFAISHTKDYRLVDVYNPWDSTKILQRYVLVDKTVQLPDSLPEGTLVRTPVTRIVTSSSIDIATFEQLLSIDDIIASFDAEYISKKSIRQIVDSGKITDLGSSRKITIEPIVVLQPELSGGSPYKGQSYGAIAKTNIPIAEVASYMETTPLGRSEWIKFYAEFVNKRPMADSIFNNIESRYLAIKEKVSKVEKKPKLLVEKKYGQAWYIPAGESYAANLHKDAGASYAWANSTGTGSLSLSFEEVYLNAKDADVWLLRYYNISTDMTYDMLKEEYSQYASFDAFINKNIYVCNTAKVDYFGSVTLQPDVELLDLAKIYHPQLFDDSELSFYERMKE